MKKQWLFLIAGAGLAGSALIAGTRAAPPAPPPAPAPVPALADRGKGVIEMPTKDVIAARTATAPFANPKVQPGKVRWHPNRVAAQVAAAQTGKPVLLFQMMGRLDDQFC